MLMPSMIVGELHVVSLAIGQRTDPPLTSSGARRGAPVRRCSAPMDTWAAPAGVRAAALHVRLGTGRVRRSRKLLRVVSTMPTVSRSARAASRRWRGQAARDGRSRGRRHRAPGSTCPAAPWRRRSPPPRSPGSRATHPRRPRARAARAGPRRCPPGSAAAPGRRWRWHRSRAARPERSGSPRAVRPREGFGAARRKRSIASRAVGASGSAVQISVPSLAP